VRALLCLIVVLAMLCKPTLASACKCGEVTQRELDERYTVFVGTAVEYLERKDDGGDPGRPGPRVNAAERFDVQYSRDVPVGSSVIVAMDMYTSCSTFFAVGERHVVVASKLGDIFYADECPTLFDDLEGTLLAQLGVPPGFLKPLAPDRDGDALRCKHPSTLDEAFDAADVVGWWDAKASCLVPGSQVVEHSAAMRWGWKGLREGEALRVRVVQDRDEPAPPPFDHELSDVTEMTWPAADFLRREGDTFINDGCLSPLAPASLEAGTEAVLRLFPLPSDYPRRHFRERPPFPTLSCMTLGDSYFAGADAAVARHVGSRLAERAREGRGPTTSAAHRGGSCAGCAVTPPSQYAPFAWSAIALAYLARRRRRARCASKPTCRSNDSCMGRIADAAKHFADPRRSHSSASIRPSKWTRTSKDSLSLQPGSVPCVRSTSAPDSSS
jgi:MYXO-CTERM domain-containing protein